MPSELLFLRTFAPDIRARLHAVFLYAKQYLTALERRGGDTYAKNGEEVATTLLEVTDDPELVAVALLHDMLLHPDGEKLLKESPLTKDEQELVRRMHSLRRLHIDAKTKDLDTVLEAFVSDPRLLPLRMAHRLNDIRHIGRFPKALSHEIARETLHMYSAIAGRLGMHAWRHEMEDACFKLLKPDVAGALEKQCTLHAANDGKCLEHVRSLLLKELALHGIEADIAGRTKSLYSTYRKMVVKRRRFTELTDRLAVRIVVKATDECYRALGIVHATFHPIPGKLKDYIGAPKENGYRSIHTVVYPLAGVSEYPVEIQIRTPDMDEECEYGSARHADYKHCLYGFHSPFARVDLFSNLLVLRESAHSPEQFETLLRTYFNDKQIAVFDPENHLYHLTVPVSALDFACHTAGKRVRYLKKIRINGRPAPPDALLHDGDTVECRFGREVLLTKTWLKACRQASSRNLLKPLLSNGPA